MTDQKHKTTAQHFAYFKKGVRLWVQRFGLVDWDLVIVHEENENMAWCSHNCQARAATIGLGDSWPRPVTEAELEATAVHEVAHLLTARFEYLAMQRSLKETELDEEMEAVANRITAVILRKLR
jgi:hypothetical protein